MLIKRGSELQKYIYQLTDDSWEQRDFVQSIKKYTGMCYEKVLAVSGLRGTGKTTGLLQSITDCANTLYLCAQKGKTETGKDYLDVLMDCPENIIIIDEYTWIKDRKDLDFYLYTLVQDGKHVLITGTESFTLEFLNYGNLIHRVEYLHTTKFTFEEYCRLFEKEQNGKTCQEYLKFGGVFNPYVINNFDSMQQYVKTAYIDNLVEYFQGMMSEQEVRDIVYTIFYHAICDSTKNTTPVIKSEDDRLRLFERLRVRTNEPIDTLNLRRITDILCKIEAIHTVYNYKTLNEDYPEFRTYITNPALATQMFFAVYDQLPEKNALGYTFEAMCVSHMHQRVYEGDELYYVESKDGNNYEMDFIITGKKRKNVYFFNCKYATAPRLKSNMSILKTELADLFPDADSFYRYVVYNGVPSYRTCFLSNGEEAEVLYINLSKMLEKYYRYEENKAMVEGGAKCKSLTSF